jgi:uncharacterized membrane protein YeaQ/YmgE (transglycosylase-associated protein family)
MYDIIAWIFFGLIVGIIAKFLMPGEDPKGCIITVLLGIGGAFLGGYIADALDIADDSKPVQYLVAIGGAMLLLVVYRLLFVRGNPRD